MATDRTVVVRLKANVGDFVTGMTTARAAVRGITSEIDTTNDRVAWLSQGILAIGPTLAPLGAAAIPIFTGIATQATVAVGAVGAMALAFNGIGDALKAVNDYQLEPTAANFAKLQEAMDKIGPAGAEFVMFLDSIEPELRSLQNLAREGILPGAQDGLEELLTLLPRARGLMTEFAQAVGQLMREAGEGLAGPGFVDFFDFLERNARPILLDLGRTIGNFARGFADLLVGFEPVSQRFSTGLLQMSEDFANWAADLENNPSFQAFLDYIDESIPKALEFGAALSEAFVAIITAAAPVGDVMLPALSEVLRIIAALAETPLGPIFIAAAAAMSVYGRAVAIASVSTSGLGKAMGTMTSNLFAGSAGVRTLGADLRSMAGEYDRLGKAQSVVLSGMSQTTGAAQRARAAIAAVGRTSALVAGLAAVTSGVTDNMSLASTATYTLMGYLVGGAPGAAAGGLVGVMMDFNRAADRAGDANRKLGQDMRSAGNDIGAQIDALSSARDELAAFKEDVTSDNIGEFIGNAFDPDAILENLRMLSGAGFMTGFETEGSKMADALREAEIRVGDLQLAARLLAEEMNMLGDDGSASVSEMTAALEYAQPAMAALGVTTDDLIAAVRDGSIMDLIGSLGAWQTAADSTAGRTRAVEDAVANLDNELMSTADSADALASALEALLGPKLNLSEAMDEWTRSVRTLDNELDKNNKTLRGNSKAALTNRAAVRDRVKALTDVLRAEADAGASAADLSRSLQDQRRKLIAAGEAAGISKRQMREYINELGLTPKLVETLIKANTGQAEAALRAVRGILDTLNDKTINVRVNRYSVEQGGPGIMRAEGGPVYGPGGPKDDMIPAWLSNREYVIKAEAVDHYGMDLFHSLNAMRFADGGTPRRPDNEIPNRGDSSWHALGAMALAAEAASQSLAALNRLLKQTEKAIDRDRRARDAMASLMESLGQTVRDQLRSDIFAEPANPWRRQLSDIEELNQDTANAREEARLIESLSGKGLKGAALAEVIGGGLLRLRAYDQLSRADLAAYTAAFQRRERALSVAGKAAGQAAYGSEYARLDAALRDELKELREIKKAIKHADDNNKKGHDESGSNFAAAASRAARRRRRRRIYQNTGRR